MKILFKFIKWMLILLTILFLGYFVMLIFNDEWAMQFNEDYYLYAYIQTVHVFTSLSVLFVIWSNNLFDKWKKIDQTLLVLFLSIIGLWIWYIKSYPKYIKFENEKDIN